MKFKTTILSATMFVLMMASCSPSLSTFNQKLYEENQWSEEELKKIQFYLSDDIILTRVFEKGETQITNGKIKTINGQQIEELRFKKGTPGVFLFSPKENRFAISFENSVEPSYLIFGPNPKFGNRYALFGKEWNRNSGQVTYQDKVYNTSTSSAWTTLMVDLTRIKKSQVSRKTAEGRVVE